MNLTFPVEQEGSARNKRVAIQEVHTAAMIVVDRK